MSILSRISKLMISPFNNHGSRNEISQSSHDTCTPDIQMSDVAAPKRTMQKPPDEPTVHASFSVVDMLMARAANRAAKEIFEDDNDHLVLDWNVDMTEVVASIETHNDRFGPNSTSSASDSPRKSEDGDEQHPTSKEQLNAADAGINVRAKYQSQISQCSEMVQQGWEEDSILAYLKLDRRGFEPLFPSSWKMDFVLFPAMLFTEDDDSAFIRSFSGKNWRAIHEFDNFCKVGIEVRSSQAHHTYPARRPEAILTKYIKNYIKWAWLDAGLTHDLQTGIIPSFLTVMCARYSHVGRHDRAELLNERLLCRLREMGDQLLSSLPKSDTGSVEPQYLITPPSMFGFAVLDCIVGIVAYEPLSRTARTIGFFSFCDRHVEIMSTISLAVIIHWVRYGLMRLKDILVMPLDINESSDMFSSAEDDPDA